MAEIVHTIEVLPKTGEGMIDSRGEAIRRQLSNDHGIMIDQVRSTLGYLIKGDFSDDELVRATRELFSDPIIEDGQVNQPFIGSGHLSTEPNLNILIGFKS